MRDVSQCEPASKSALTCPAICLSSILCYKRPSSACSRLGLRGLRKVSSGGLILHVHREDTRILVLAEGIDANLLSGAAEPIDMVRLRHDLRDLGGFFDMKFANGHCYFRASIPLHR